MSSGGESIRMRGFATFRRCGIACFDTTKVPRALIWCIRSKRRMSVCCTGVSWIALALLTTISAPPNFSAVASSACFTFSSSRTSTTSGSALPPAASISAAAGWMVPGSLGCGVSVFAAIAMLAPSRVAFSAIASPMPREAPVMNSVLPVSDMGTLPAFLQMALAPPRNCLRASLHHARPINEGAMQLTGIHHLTAISADAGGNKRFYTGTMGMRMVKKTVNQDDTSAYHLFYADALARPGTDLTFFDWPAPPESRGTHAIARTGLRIAGPESFQWWKEHLNEAGVKTAEIAERDGRLTLDFEDPEGQRLSLINDGGAGEAYPWEKSPVPAMHQIRGLGPISLSVPDLKATEAVLTTLMGMREVRSYPHPDNAKHTVHVFEMGDGGAGAELHVAVQPDLRPAQQGAGGVHHVAFRTPDNEYDGWAERLNRVRGTHT